MQACIAAVGGVARSRQLQMISEHEQSALLSKLSPFFFKVRIPESREMQKEKNEGTVNAFSGAISSCAGNWPRGRTCDLSHSGWVECELKPKQDEEAEAGPKASKRKAVIS